MDKENQPEKKLSAPEVDHMIYQAEHIPDVSDDRTKPLVLKLFQKMMSIEACGDDELRELWLTAPRGSIERFGDYKSYLEDGEVESRKEFEELWLSNYPDPQKWYLLSTTIYKDIYSVFINNKLVLLIQPKRLMTGITTKPIMVGIHGRSVAEGILLTFPCTSVMTREAGGSDWPVPA